MQQPQPQESSVIQNGLRTELGASVVQPNDGPGHYEKPTIVYFAPLEVLASSCNQADFTCGTPSI